VRQRLIQARRPGRPPGTMKPGDFHSLMALDKKNTEGRLRLVLLRSLGEAVVTSEFDPEALEDVLQAFCEAQ